VHRYVDCDHVGSDGLHDWRNAVREDFMEHINVLRNEVELLIQERTLRLRFKYM